MIYFDSSNYGFLLKMISLIIIVRFVGILLDSNISLAISVFNVGSIKLTIMYNCERLYSYHVMIITFERIGHPLS
ncbi:MAG TPA: hypothetical protein VJ697_10590 [Nitrososphaeraceae archaeon]|nr:hypothetical protein [Nitrososphaeraceae archaeon]